eukprot:2903974-Prorocentrum_lima.AAC.1
MTSSLVGSEMCIRDRGNVARRHASLRAKVLTQSLKLASIVHLYEKGRTAVSYTHLTLPTICSV